MPVSPFSLPEPEPPTVMVCHDPRHAEPCRTQPCLACAEDCDIRYMKEEPAP